MNIPRGYILDPKTGALMAADRVVHARYDDAYVRRYENYPEKRLSEIRADLIRKTVGKIRNVCDVGFGTGAFLKEMAKRDPQLQIWGWDIATYQKPKFINLSENWQDVEWDCLTFFDSLEHIPDLSFTTKIKAKAIVVSCPWCHWPTMPSEWLMSWRHLRPGEHLWHFAPAALIRLFPGYRCVYAGNPEDEIRRSADALPNILTVILARNENPD